MDDDFDNVEAGFNSGIQDQTYITRVDSTYGTFLKGVILGTGIYSD